MVPVGNLTTCHDLDMKPSEQNLRTSNRNANRSRFNRISNVAWVSLTGLIVWFVVAVVIGRIVVAIFPPSNPMARPPMIPLGSFDSFRFGFGVIFETANGRMPVGISLNWWDLPGTIIGALLAFMLVRYFFRRPRKS
jgi:hypothetical protein